MNPFARVNIYTPEVAKAYSGKRKGELEPHLFAVAEEAYRCMAQEGKNQSIIVSGESGAGSTYTATICLNANFNTCKLRFHVTFSETISAKYIMRYFAAVGKFDSEDAVLSSNLSIDHLASSDPTETRPQLVDGVEQQVLATNPVMEVLQLADLCMT